MASRPPACLAMKRNKGFTLLQTLVALAVLAALVVLATSSHADATAKARTASARSALVQSILASSRRAIVHAETVVLCPSSEGLSCDDSIEWSRGWIAFPDGNLNRSPDPNEKLLLRQPPLDGPMRVYSTEGRRKIVFQPRGHTAGSNVTFTLCASATPGHASTLVVANSGIWRTGRPDVRSRTLCSRGP